MEIPDKGPLQAPILMESAVDGPHASPPADAPKGPADSSGKDSVRLTDAGREFNRAVDQVQTLPDVRLERVMQLKQQLAQGTYRVEGRRIAVNMIDESMENNSVLKHINTKA